MAQDQGTYPGLCLLTDSDGKVITIEDSVSHDTVVFTHTNTGEGEFAICYPEVLGSGVPEAALANFGTHNVENTATQGYAFTLGDEEYLVRQNVIAPTPGEINDVLYSRSLVVDSSTMDVLVTEDGSVVSYFNGELDVCFVKFTNGEWHAETAYYDQIVEASGSEDSVSIGCTVADGVYTIKYGFNNYVLTEDSLTPAVTAVPVKEFFARNYNTDSRFYKKAVKMVKFGNGSYAFQVVKITNFEQQMVAPTNAIYAPVYIDTEDIPLNSVVSGDAKLSLFNNNRVGYLDLIDDSSDSAFFVNAMGLGVGQVYVVAEYDAQGATLSSYDIDLPADVELESLTFEQTLILGVLNELPAALNTIEKLDCNVNFTDIDVQDVVLKSAAGDVTFNNDNLVQNDSNIGTYAYSSAGYSYNLTSQNTSQITDVTYDAE